MIPLAKKGKKGVEKGSASKSTPTFPTAVAPLSIIVAKPSAKKNQFHSTEEPVVIPSGSTLSSQLPPITTMDMPTREELDKLLKCFPSVTNMELPLTNMNDLFPATQRIPIEVYSDPEQSFIIRVLFRTPNNIIEAVMLMKRYSALQMTKVVKVVLFFVFSFLSHILHLTFVYLRL